MALSPTSGLRFALVAGAALLVLLGAPRLVSAVGVIAFRPGDVVALVGGEAVVQEGETGHLESLLTAANAGKGLRFRNLAREGDTVFEQPRDVNFPTLAEQLTRVGATVVIAQFGHQESMAGPAGIDAFVTAYENLCDEWSKQARLVVLVAPAPFEKPANPLLPDLSARNVELKQYVDATRRVAERRGHAFIDLFTGTGAGERPHVLTDNGMRPNACGSAAIAKAFVYAADMDSQWAVADADPKNGHWTSPELEALRQAIVAKNRLWFDYSRPMNWAFLGGDRVQVASSRDHRDPNVRWFPDEMEKFVPLIEEAEKRIDDLAVGATPASPALRAGASDRR